MSIYISEVLISFNIQRMHFTITETIDSNFDKFLKQIKALLYIINIFDSIKLVDLDKTVDLHLYSSYSLLKPN